MTTPPAPAPVRPTPTHRELEAALEAHFNRTVRLNLGGRAVKLAPTEKGLPDRLVLLPGGQVYLVELKTTTGRLSAAQDLWHERAAQLGTRVQVLVGRQGIDAWVRQCAERIDGPPTRPMPRNK